MPLLGQAEECALNQPNCCSFALTQNTSYACRQAASRRQLQPQSAVLVLKYVARHWTRVTRARRRGRNRRESEQRAGTEDARAAAPTNVAYPTGTGDADPVRSPVRTLREARACFHVRDRVRATGRGPACDTCSSSTPAMRSALTEPPRSNARGRSRRFVDAPTGSAPRPTRAPAGARSAARRPVA
jgi:hypothetical protein